MTTKRLKAMGTSKYQNDGDPRTSGPGFAVTAHADVLTGPHEWRSPRLVFVNSMSDLFHAKVPLAFVKDVFDVMRETPRHTYQILTKRSRRLLRMADKLTWPANVWMGVSVEDHAAMRRIDDLRQVPATVRFLSCEPLIGPLEGLDLAGIQWVIVGGESPHLNPDTQPTPTRVLAELPHHAWVHLSCHGSQHFTEPTESAFWLTDGPLRVTDLIKQRDPGPRELAFLFACQTATGTPDADHAAHALHHGVTALRARCPTEPLAWAPYLHTGP